MIIGIFTPPNTRPLSILNVARSVALWTLGLIAALMLLVAFFAPKAMAVLLAVMGLISALQFWADRVASQARSRAALRLGRTELFLLLLLAFGAISGSWSTRPLESLSTALGLAGTLACGLITIHFVSGCRAAERNCLHTAVMVGGFVGFGLLACELATGHLVVRAIFELTGRHLYPENISNIFKPGLTVAALYIWPWGYALSRRYGIGSAVALAAGAAAVIALHDSRSAAVGLIAGVFVALIAALRAQSASRWLAVLIFSGVFSMPLLAHLLPDPVQPRSHLEFLTNSAVHRIHIWRNTAALIPDAPILGRGLDSSRMLYDGSTQEAFIFLPDRAGGGFTSLSEPIPLHPHNFVLQVWLELGAMGALLLSGLLIALVHSISSLRGARERFVSFGALTCGIIIANVSFGAWQSWWLASLFLTVILVVALTRDIPSVDEKNEIL